MQQFIPFEDDWAMAEVFAGHRLVPYQPGMACAHRDAQESTQGGIVQRKQQKLFAPSSQPQRSAL